MTALLRVLLRPWRRWRVRRELRRLSRTQALWAIVGAPVDKSARFAHRLRVDRERRA